MTRTPRFRAAAISMFAAAALMALSIPSIARQQKSGTGSAQQKGFDQPGTKWTDEQLRQTVAVVRVGKKLTPKSWPNHSKVAVCLSFDDDTEAPLLRDGTTSPTALSASDFGAESGTPRLLKILDRYRVPATFFVTGVDAMLHPDMLALIQSSGRNEIGIWLDSRIHAGPRIRSRRRASARQGDRHHNESHRKAAGRLSRSFVGLQSVHSRSHPQERLRVRQQS